MNKEITKYWLEGFKAGENAVLKFLKEIKNLDFEKEYKNWSNYDEDDKELLHELLENLK